MSGDIKSRWTSPSGAIYLLKDQMFHLSLCICTQVKHGINFKLSHVVLLITISDPALC